MIVFRAGCLAVAVFAAAMPWPSTAFAREGAAGVVSTLEGTVSAKRVALPQPVPLAAKDDVYLRDRITTADRSFARLLLGGKALITVREHSALTISEVPGQSSINVESGKVGIFVARERMKPGEALEFRTPNAIGAVRGTSLVIEVTAGVSGIITDVYVFHGNVDLAPLAGDSPGNAPTAIHAGTSGRVGAGPGVTTNTIAPGDVAGINAGLQPSGVGSAPSSTGSEARENAMNATTLLMGALFGGGLPSPGSFGHGGLGDFVRPVGVTVAPLVANINSVPGSNESLPSGSQGPTVASGTPPSDNTPPSNGTPPGGSSTPPGSDNPTPPAAPGPTGSSGGSNSGGSNSGGSNNGGGNSGGGNNGGGNNGGGNSGGGNNAGGNNDDLIYVAQGTTLTPAGSLVTSIDHDINGNAIHVVGTLNEPGTSPLIDLTDATLRVGKTVANAAVLNMDGATATATLNGQLLTGDNLILHSSADIIRVTGGATLTSNTTKDFVSLTDGSLGTQAEPIAGNFLTITGSGSSFTLGGALLNANSADKSVVNGSVVKISDGGQLTLPGGSDLVKIAGNGTVSLASDAGRAVFELIGRGDPGHLSGGIGTDSPIQQTGKQNTNLLTITGNANVTSQSIFKLDTALYSASAPILNLVNSTLATAQPAINLVQKAQITNTGPLVSVSGSTFNLSSALVQVDGGSVLKINAGNGSLYGDLLSVGGGSTIWINGAPLLLVQNGASVNIYGALVGFSGNNNTVTVTNTLCDSSTCTNVKGIVVANSGGAVNISGSPIRNAGPKNQLKVGNNHSAMVSVASGGSLTIQGK